MLVSQTSHCDSRAATAAPVHRIRGGVRPTWAAVAARLFVVASALALAAAPSAEAGEPLRVSAITFNIRHDNPRDGANRWTKRTDLVAGVVRDRKPDFVGVQEALPHQVVELSELWPGYAKVGRSREANRFRGEATPIYYRSDRWKAIEHETFWLSDTPNEPGSRNWGNGIPRIATVATFEQVRTKQRVTVLNTHFDHRSQPSRQKSSALIVQRLKKVDGHVIVMGDLNAGEDNQAIRTLRDAGYVDTFRQVHPDAKSVGTFSAWNGKTDGAKIDYVFVRKGVKTIDAEIVHDNDGGRYPSDHYPVAATVEWGGERHD